MQRTIIQDIPQEVKYFLDMQPGLQKNFTYSKLNKQYVTIDAGKEGDNVYYSSQVVTIKRGKSHYYLKQSHKSGLSFKDGKVNVWFGKSIMEQGHLDHLFTFMNWNFIETQAYGYITKGILEKIFKGKITNTRALLEAYAKSVRYNVSTELMYQAVKTGMTKMNFLTSCSIAKDPNHYLELYTDGKLPKDYQLQDLIQQFLILDKKVDFKWSLARVKEEHKKATKDLMKLELDTIGEFDVTYPDLVYPPEFTLLDSQRKVFEEGSIMGHCLYTNYWSSIKSGNYLAFHITLGGEEATLGLSYYNHSPEFNQLYGPHNSQVSPEMNKFCMEWFERATGKKFIKGQVLF